MEIKFADSFGDSLKTMIRHNTWWYKTYELFRYDIPRFIKNIWRFRRGLWRHHWFDHHGTLVFLEIGLTHIANRIEKDGIEVDESRLKKVSKMRRVVEIIKNYNDHNFVEMAEKELGELHLQGFSSDNFVEDESFGEGQKFYTYVSKLTEEEKNHNHKVYTRAREIEENEWIELCETLKGQDYSKFSEKIDFDKQFDGSGIKSWWD